ncbi:MAG TPA: hypothetical protein VFK09_04025, partial [Gemmatimonadales bacterium]|nr:hypothetical protein [Gemmatimonadales bacterium]
AAQSRVRVTPQLIRVSDDSHMWADRYDAVLADVFEVQSKIAEQVVGALNVSLAGSERQVLHAKPAENPEAYDLYLQGVDYFNRGVDARDLQSAAGLFSRAVALDSNFARAWAMLAQTRALSYWEYYDHSPANLEAVRQSVERAFALAPDFPEVRIARGYYFYWGRRDYSAALQEFERARQNGGDAAQLLNAIGLVQRRQGRWDEALASLREAARREPRVRAYANDLGETACLMRLYDECARIAAGMIQLTPDSYNGYAYQINARLALADLAGARRSLDSGSVQVGREQMLGRVTLFWLPQATEAERREIAGLSMAAFGMDTVSYFRDKAKAWRLLGEGQRARTYYDSLRVYLEQRLAAQADDPAYHGNLGVALAWLGRAPEAVREARRGAELLPLSKDAYAGGDQLVWLAEAQTVGGMADSALANLARALAGPGWFNRTLLANDPTWAPLRSHPRYRELVAGGSR